MQAVIYCGGFGSRLGNKTKKIPKPILKINNIPFLFYIIKDLQRYGIKEIILLTYYKHEKIVNFIESLKTETRSYKERLLLKMGNNYDLVMVKNIKYLYSAEKLSYVVTKEGTRFSSYDSLGKLEKDLDPMKFFRINRKMIINIDSIHKVKPFTKGKLRVVMLDDNENELVVSQTRSNNFRKWFC